LGIENGRNEGVEGLRIYFSRGGCGGTEIILNIPAEGAEWQR
jgi:hypothetical protein